MPIELHLIAFDAGIPGGYHTYTITTLTSLPSWPSTESKVVRRFRDVVALSDMLVVLLPGCILPARPKRDALGARRATPEFLEVGADGTHARVSGPSWLTCCHRHTATPLHGGMAAPMQHHIRTYAAPTLACPPTAIHKGTQLFQCRSTPLHRPPCSPHLSYITAAPWATDRFHPHSLDQQMSVLVYTTTPFTQSHTAS